MSRCSSILRRARSDDRARASAWSRRPRFWPALWGPGCTHTSPYAWRRVSALRRPGPSAGSTLASAILPPNRLCQPAQRCGDRHVLTGTQRPTKSRRTLGLPQIAVDALRVHEIRQIAERRAAGVQQCDHDLVFSTRTGVPLRELRHSFVSLMSSSGVPVEEIARLAGHSSSRTTEVVHRRELRPVLTTGAEAMDRLSRHPCDIGRPLGTVSGLDLRPRFGLRQNRLTDLCQAEELSAIIFNQRGGVIG
jgi:hypothetical protein